MLLKSLEENKPKGFDIKLNFINFFIFFISSI
jgi:hypothetical protein